MLRSHEVKKLATLEVPPGVRMKIGEVWENEKGLAFTAPSENIQYGCQYVCVALLALYLALAPWVPSVEQFSYIATFLFCLLFIALLFSGTINLIALDSKRTFGSEDERRTYLFSRHCIALWETPSRSKKIIGRSLSVFILIALLLNKDFFNVMTAFLGVVTMLAVYFMRYTVRDAVTTCIQENSIAGMVTKHGEVRVTKEVRGERV